MKVGWKTRGQSPHKIVRMVFLFIAVSVLGFAISGQELGQRESDQSKDPPKPDKSPSEQSDQSKQASQDPIDRSDELKSKLTFGTYLLSDALVYDINLRHQFGDMTAWIAGFYDPKGTKLARVGAQYDYKYKWIHVVPTLEAASTKAIAGQLYSEIGGDTYAIAGFSLTNLKPFFDLFWDPSESLQLGLGRKINNYDRINLYTIFDVRLHTGQQNTHLVWRHRLNGNNGVTFDALFKSGHRDDGKYIRNVGFGVYYDRPAWFWKLYYDPQVNFADQTMMRFGIGLKF
jgi:hypothetical protein